METHIKYDPFQQKAIDHINAGHSVMISAPTGAGKTVIAEHVINDCLARGSSAIYTAPIKALSNQKYRDFKDNFGDKIGILTGDVSINPSAPILIMTTEIFRNKLLEKSNDLERYSWIIFDEIHYLDDYERGTVWEESLIFLPEHMKLLALSATVPNINEFADWIRSIHKKPVHIVTETERPVPLHFFYQCQGEIVDSLQKVNDSAYKGKDFSPRHHRGRRYPSHQHHHLKPNRATSLIKHLSDRGRLPCIYFAFGRRRCEYLADEMSGFDFVTSEEKAKIRELFGSLCRKYDLETEKRAVHMAPLIERGIAFHHAGMLPTLKEVVEQLFTSRLIKVIFTTETFALGINMPARTVIFDELRKFYGRGFATIKTRDFYQMAGRAGRRGIDEEGFVYSRVKPTDVTFQELKRIVYGEPEAVRSRFNVSYATILNLYTSYGEKLYDIYPLSFHYFNEKSHSREQALRSMRSKVRILKELEYIKDGQITDKGVFASKVYGYELSLTEFFDRGLLESLSETELAILCLGLVFEPRKGILRPSVAKSARTLRETTSSLLKPIHRLERRYGITPLSKLYCYDLTPCIEAWIRGESFEKILTKTDFDEGGIIRYFRMAIQILREILETPISKELSGRIYTVIDRINRGVVDAESQLRG